MILAAGILSLQQGSGTNYVYELASNSMKLMIIDLFMNSYDLYQPVKLSRLSFDLEVTK